MSFIYKRTIHFSDTDAAGIVFFARYLSICHESFEEALKSAGIPIREFFSMEEVMAPIAHCEADYLRSLYVGDEIEVSVKGERTESPSTFVVRYEIGRKGKLVAKVQTKHVCIASKDHWRVPIPEKLAAWLSE